jgi:putative transposase
MRGGLKPSPKALFRNHVVSEVRARVLAGRTQAQAIRAVMEQPHVDHLGRPRTLFARTVSRWLRDHAEGGYAALEDESRRQTADSTVLPAKFLDFLCREKRSDVDASVPELIRRARAWGVIKPDDHVCRTSVWRASRRLGISLTRRRRLADTDMRRYAYPHRMLMVLADGKHFRAGTARLKRVALVFLDDATRYGLDVMVGTSENTSLFLGGLHEVIRRFGLMLALFLDRGAGFKSDDTHATCARLGIAFIHGTAAYPEGHGKIEKFNQTWGAQLLRSFDGNPAVDPDPQSLRLRLLHYLHSQYARTPHQSLDGQTPEQRWNSDPRSLSFPQDRAWLEERFVTTFERSVSKDNVIPYEGTDYEVPRGHAGTEICVYKNLLRDTLAVHHEERLVAIHPVDLVANTYSRRARAAQSAAPVEPPIVQTAAQLAFQAEFAPLVDNTGGYPKGDDEP